MIYKENDEVMLLKGRNCFKRGEPFRFGSHLMRGGHRLVIACLLAMLVAVTATQAAAPARPRVVVLSDIGNEPDDQMSLVRLLVYSNELNIEAFVASTSTWQRDKLRADIAQTLVDAYAQVRPNLMLHADGWPTAKELSARVVDGVPGYGMAAINTASPSTGAEKILELAMSSEESLWVLGWGGVNTLAEALSVAQERFSADVVAQIISRLRVYTISDQDDAGHWLRQQFPDLFYIASPSSQDGADYARATWTGISGDRFYRNGAGADVTTVTNEWLQEHIGNKGPLGKRYPEFLFIMEGDTPSFLGLIPNGLQSMDQPHWGGWGGRYVLRQPAGESRSIWTQGGDSFPRVTSADAVNGVVSDQATIWRWREAFQHDFAARMDWTIKAQDAANHPPAVIVNGSDGIAPVRVSLRSGQSLVLDAAESSDPDGDALDYHWFWYPEAGYSVPVAPAVIRVADAHGPKTQITVEARCAPAWFEYIPCPAVNEGHVILAVRDRGTPALTRYRRVIVSVADTDTQPD